MGLIIFFFQGVIDSKIELIFNKLLDILVLRSSVNGVEIVMIRVAFWYSAMAALVEGRAPGVNNLDDAKRIVSKICCGSVSDLSKTVDVAAFL